MENIKLIIWDLDETFWKGTISDGEITPVQKNIELIKTLTDRGIINSICSKNDYEVAKKKLEELGVWEYFVFPSIDWTMKGARIQNIIKEMQLRPINCLFLDDNQNNLQEAKFILPELEVSLPDIIPTLLDNPSFKGKDDSSHSRLNQYKVLEQKAQERLQFANNDDFLFQSEIQVEMIEKTEDKLERIYEMIHRNNQLNFTKDRISQEEVNKIFTDNSIRSGVVHVKDKYGDHGIIGCYAIKDGKALQFVFSCRILGMGVEQWCYAELGCPEIKIVGDVAAELKKDVKPAYINQETTKCCSQEQEEPTKETPKLIVYGTCPLRPVWAYLQPKLPNAKFAEIDPAPPVCNLGAPLQMAEYKKKEILENVKTISYQSFDNEILNGEFDYLLVTLRYDATSTYKYVSKEKGISFYCTKLNADNTNKSFLDEFTETKIIPKDIEKELINLINKMPAQATLLIQTLTEAKFPNEKPEDYNLRVQINKISDSLCKKYSNVKLVDIRKYANTPASFWDPVPEHYNRQIGFSLASDIFEYMGIETNKKVAKSEIPQNAITEVVKPANFSAKEIKYTEYIKNFRFKIKCEVENPEKYLYKFQLFQNRFISTSSEYSDNPTFETDISTTRTFQYLCFIKDKETQQVFNFYSQEIKFNEYNYFNYCDYEENLDDLKASIKNFSISAGYEKFTTRQCITEVINLLANNINLADYFKSKNIYEISIYTDLDLGRIILPILHNSNIKIKNIYYDEYLWSIYINGRRLGAYNYNLVDINQTPKLNGNDTLLYAVTDGKRFNFKIFNKTGCKIFYLPRILTELYTKAYFVNKFVNKINNPKLISVKVPEIFRDAIDNLNWLSLKPSEKLINEFKIQNDQTLLERLKNNDSKITDYAKQMDKDVLLETLIRPQMYNDPTNTPKFKDISSKNLNIKDGFRITTNQPKNYNKTIYIMGDAVAFGCGVKDSETIASYLQNLVKENFRVVNYANIWPMSEYSKVLELYDKTAFKPDDIVVFLVNYREDKTRSGYDHWLNFEAIDNPVKKIDSINLFKQIDRPDYFIAPNAYTKECNEALAKLIFDNI